MKLEEAAEILARGTVGVEVRGDKSVDPSQVRRIAQEWLSLTAPKWHDPTEPYKMKRSEKASFWKSLLRSARVVDRGRLKNQESAGL